MRGVTPRLGYLFLPLLLGLILAAVWFFGMSLVTPAGAAGEEDFSGLPAARMEQLPTWHGGSLFTFELHFADDTNLSFRDVRDDMFEVDGGRVTRAPRIDKSSNQSWLVHVRPEGFGDVTISGLGMTASVPGPGDRLAARISELPSRHDGGQRFTARLDFNREPNLEWRNVRDHVVVVTGGDVNRSPRVVKGSNLAWTLMITPDGDGTVGIAVPITGSCGNQSDVCDYDGTMLADGAWRTVRGPDRNALTRPANTVGNTETQPPIRPEEPTQTDAAEVQGATGIVLPKPDDIVLRVMTECDCEDGMTPIVLPEATSGTVYTYSLVGDLPDYLTFSRNTRTLFGRPVEETDGPVTFTYSALGFVPGEGVVTVEQEFTITVNPHVAVDSPADLEFQVGVPIEPVVLNEGVGGVPPLTYRIDEMTGDPLPPGLSFDPATRTISGTPREESERRIFYQVTDSNGETDQKRFNITIRVNDGVIAGTISAGEPIDLPEGASITVYMADYTMMEAVFLAETAVDGSSLPVEFALEYDTDDIDEDRLYSLFVCVMYEGRMILGNLGPVPVLTQGYAEDRDVLVERTPAGEEVLASR